MKKNIVLVLGIIVFCSPAMAQSSTITVSSLPTTIDDFLKLRNQIATSPEGGAVVMLTALQMYAKNKDLGLQAITIALDASNLEKGNVYKGFKPHRSFNYHLSRMDKIPYAAFAYVKGATPANGYNVSGPMKYELSRNKYSGSEASRKVKVFVAVYGVSARPVKLKKNDKGLWKAVELSSLFLNVQAPASNASDDL